MNEALQNLLTRRSCRAYTEEQVKPEALDAILEAGKFAPTGMGKQTPLMTSPSNRVFRQNSASPERSPGL